MCPHNYHRESLTLCKYGGNQTLTEKRPFRVKFSTRLYPIVKSAALLHLEEDSTQTVAEWWT
jgi:hypothetical protein